MRRELQALSTRIEAQVTSCWTCEQSQTTYRLRTPLSARTVSDPGPSIVLMILDRPTCPDCIAFRKSITVDQVKAALDVIADVVNVCRESGTCRVCGELADVVSVRHGERRGLRSHQPASRHACHPDAH